MGTYETLEYTVTGGIATITLNRPEAFNSVNLAMAEEVSRVAMECDADNGVRAVIITGKGRFFSAGGDIQQMVVPRGSVRETVKALASYIHMAIATFARMRAPVIVAVNGTAAGGGFGLAVCGDFVVAAESASFVMAYTQSGLSPDAGSSYYLPRLIGLRKTQELMFTNRKLSAADALDWGLVSQIVPDAQLMDTAMQLATKLGNGPANSHACIKQLLADTFDRSLEAQMELEGRCIADCADSGNGREGVAAFLAKRHPLFNERCE
jgi:2-(1,2-epoxy-1,2-dihydrophenyl)acetyl-CoA isomerase